MTDAQIDEILVEYLCNHPTAGLSLAKHMSVKWLEEVGRPMARALLAAPVAPLDTSAAPVEIGGVDRQEGDDTLAELRASIAGLNYLVKAWRDRAVAAGWKEDAPAAGGAAAITQQEEQGDA